MKKSARGRPKLSQPFVLSKTRRVVKIRHQRHRVLIHSSNNIATKLEAAAGLANVGRSLVVSIRCAGGLTSSPKVHALTMLRNILWEQREEYARNAVIYSGRRTAEGFSQWQLLYGPAGYRLAGLRDMDDEVRSVERKLAEAVSQEELARKKWCGDARFCELCSAGFQRDSSDHKRTCTVTCSKRYSNYLDRVRRSLGRVARRAARAQRSAAAEPHKDPLLQVMERIAPRVKASASNMAEIRRKWRG